MEDPLQEPLALTDTHAHLDLDIFNADRVEVIRRAKETGLIHILLPGLNVNSSRHLIQMSESFPLLFAAIGVHPTEASGFNSSTINDLRKMAQSPKVKAVGEIGLDYFWDAASRARQQDLLKAQLDLAGELHLPVVIHFREKGDAPTGKCSETLLKILASWVAELQRNKDLLSKKPGVLHSFSGTIEMAQIGIALGFFIGVTGPITFKSNQRRQDLVAALPLDHILIETDSPFLAPVPHRGKRNEPAFVRLIADKIASIYSCPFEQVAAITCENAQRLFNWE